MQRATEFQGGKKKTEKRLRAPTGTQEKKKLNEVKVLTGQNQTRGKKGDTSNPASCSK